MSSPTYLDKLLVNLNEDNCPVCVDSYHALPDSPPEPDDDTPTPGIALLPCGHAFHNYCLTLWLPQANSCPICRNSFNQVEVLDKVGGVLASTYEVADKEQVAEFDAAAWAAENPDEEEEEELDLCCPVCQLYDTQDIVVICDGCEDCYHPICAGLADIPTGDWYCQVCRARTVDVRAVSRWAWPAAVTRRSPPRQERAREFHRRRVEERGRNEQHGRPRAQGRHPVWTSISNRIHDAADLEVDFLDDDPSMANFRRVQNRASEEQRERREWEERLNSANRRIATGAGSSPHNSISNQRQAVTAGLRPYRTSATHERAAPSAHEQLIAWGDLDRAQHLDTETSASRKRERGSESSVASPVEPSERQEPERRLKRPRTRAVVDNGASTATSSSSHTPRRPAISTQSEPSFLASLLREVESAAGEQRFRWSSSGSAQEQATSPSNYHTSPGTSPSPVSSTYQTPRALSNTPPPRHTMRTGSAQSISSRRQSPAASSVHRHGSEPTSPTPEIRQPRPRRQERVVTSHSLETSPIRAKMPIEAKESINKMVKAALRPHCQAGKVSKDQYAGVNRDVSRKMYEIVADDYAHIERDRSRWEKIAAREVATAVNALAA